MNAFRELRIAFEPVQAAFLRSPALQRVQEGSITIDQYASFLEQVFHHTRENPQIQALATVYFRGAIKRFFRHAGSEIGHDELALEDLRTLGRNVDALPFQNPLPETTAILAFPFCQIRISIRSVTSAISIFSSFYRRRAEPR